jgi:ATP-binding cassette subfamily B protein
VFVARALLQRPDVLILDESVDALDPETLSAVLACLRERAPTLMLIAHP